jgi:hypothetical protein
MAALIEHYEGEVPGWKDHNFARLTDALAKIEATLDTLYRGAYMFNNSLIYGGDRDGEPYPRKFQGSVRLVERFMEDGVVERVCAARTVEEIFNALSNEGKYFAFSGGFLAMQLAYDLAYSDVTRAGEDDFWGTVTPTEWSYASGDRSILTTPTTFESWRRSYGGSGKNRIAVWQLSVIHPFDSSASGN